MEVMLGIVMSSSFLSSQKPNQLVRLIVRQNLVRLNPHSPSHLRTLGDASNNTR